MRSYENLRDRLVSGKFERESTLKSNREICDNIRTELDKIAEMNPDLFDRHGINLAAIRSIDLERLATDVAYLQSVRQSIGGELEKVITVLEGVLA